MYIYTVNWYRFLIAILFYISQNNYYKWNPLPRSDSELITDILIGGLIAISISKKRI